MPPIAQQGEHARVEVVEQKSVSTLHACPAARCKHGTPDFSNREVISGQTLIGLYCLNHSPTCKRG